ncbi:hypothetical protein MHYP_G00310960 [Metynnis hypsauchen]
MLSQPRVRILIYSRAQPFPFGLGDGNKHNELVVVAAHWPADSLPVDQSRIVLVTLALLLHSVSFGRHCKYSEGFELRANRQSKQEEAGIRREKREGAG